MARARAVPYGLGVPIAIGVVLLGGAVVGIEPLARVTQSLGVVGAALLVILPVLIASAWRSARGSAELHEWLDERRDPARPRRPKDGPRPTVPPRPPEPSFHQESLVKRYGTPGQARKWATQAYKADVARMDAAGYEPASSMKAAYQSDGTMLMPYRVSAEGREQDARLAERHAAAMAAWFEEVAAAEHKIAAWEARRASLDEEFRGAQVAWLRARRQGRTGFREGDHEPVPTTLPSNVIARTSATTIVALAVLVAAQGGVAAAPGPGQSPAPSLAALATQAAVTTPLVADPTTTPTRPATPKPTVRSTPPATPAPTPTSVPLGAAPTGVTETARVVRVVDGDTIVVDRGRGEERLRYIGIDTPETVHPTEPVEWMGAEASAANAELVDGREVVLELDVSETDQFDRLLRYVWVRDDAGWLLINLALVERGFAHVTTYPPDVKYVELYLEAQEAARAVGAGLWGSPPPTPAPTQGPTAKPTPKATPRPTPKPSNCHPSYEGACLKVGGGDYDCAGGSGNGPNYVAGPVYVVGPDDFDLDRDSDGIGCENG